MVEGRENSARPNPVRLYSTGMDGVELELACPCGYENFERVVVRRRPHHPIVTDFVACVGCRAVYFAPQRPLDPPEPTIGSHMKAHGGPQLEPLHDSADKLKRDAAAAATDYVKPGRSGRLKPGGRERS